LEPSLSERHQVSSPSTSNYTKERGAFILSKPVIPQNFSCRNLAKDEEIKFEESFEGLGAIFSEEIGETK